MDVSPADWLEVIRAENHEIRGVHRTSHLSDRDWLAHPTVYKELVILLEVAWLKRVRARAYTPAN
jgi:hypothetical protein